MKKENPPKSFEKRVKDIGYLYYIKYKIKMFIFTLKLKWN